MDIKHNLSKSLGPKSAKFVLDLYANNTPIFSLKEASLLTQLHGKALQKFIAPLVKKGVVCRLIQGLYSIVPFELGFAKEYMPNPFVVAREIIQHRYKNGKAPYYISHASALAIHQMTTQPQFVVYATVTKQIKQKINVMGTEFHFVTYNKTDLFGFKKFWIDKSEMILVSDIEKTIIDGLKRPEYCGGITEIAKGLWIKRHEISFSKLVDYAEKIKKSVVYRRLGFLLEIYGLNCSNEIDRLQKNLTATYHLLDPTLPNEGKHDSRWRLRINIPKDEFLSTIRT